jgi:hypothetical protein
MNANHKAATLGILVGALALVRTGSASDFNIVSGTVCQGTNSAFRGYHAYSQYGIESTAPDSSVNGLTYVMCPMVNSAESHTSDPTAFTAVVYDRSSTFPIYCSLQRLNHDGTTNWSQNQTTTASGWSWSPSTLNWTVPSNGGHGYNYQFYCQLPGVSQGNSHITTFTSAR